MDCSMPPMDFDTFVRDLNRSSHRKEPTASCQPESSLCQQFENGMMQLNTNYDVDDDSSPQLGSTSRAQRVRRERECETSSATADDSAFSVDKETSLLNESLATTVDNEDDPLELTGEELDDSGEGDGGSSADEQQQSRSLSLSFSLSVSHAHENHSQYSQSTDKGLSKRYDSPCSYEDDRESECTNLDKLDDWNDLISDMQNNNNNGDNIDLKEYYDEYLLGKGESGHTVCEVSSEGDTSDGCNTDQCDSVVCRDENPTASMMSHSSTAETVRSYASYRNTEPNALDAKVTFVNDDELWDDGSCCTHNCSLQSGGSSSSGKRKFVYEDPTDIDYELNTFIVEKFRKTSIVPDQGYHLPLNALDEHQLCEMVVEPEVLQPRRLHSSAEENNNCTIAREDNFPDDIELEEADEDSHLRTPTNTRKVKHGFRQGVHGERIFSAQTAPSRLCAEVEANHLMADDEDHIAGGNKDRPTAARSNFTVKLASI